MSSACATSGHCIGNSMELIQILTSATVIWLLGLQLLRLLGFVASKWSLHGITDVYVTSAGVNPTSTIQALALYIADAMKKRLANLFD